MDTVLRLYREHGLFTNRRAAIAALGTEATQRISPSERKLEAGEPAAFYERLAPSGIFSRPGWTGKYSYNGWVPPGKTKWHAKLAVLVDRNKDCVDSRAVEGYLDLFLQTGLDGYDHPIPSERWDRHQFGGMPYALALSKTTPSVALYFSQNCLSGVTIGNTFEYQQVNDDQTID